MAAITGAFPRVRHRCSPHRLRSLTAAPPDRSGTLGGAFVVGHRGGRCARLARCQACRSEWSGAPGEACTSVCPKHEPSAFPPRRSSSWFPCFWFVAKKGLKLCPVKTAALRQTLSRLASAVPRSIAAPRKQIFMPRDRSGCVRIQAIPRSITLNRSPPATDTGWAMFFLVGHGFEFPPQLSTRCRPKGSLTVCGRTQRCRIGASSTTSSAAG